MYLHKDRDAFRDLIEQVSGKTGRTPMVVEKDYYVTLVLQLLSEQLSNCVFKGGTSLSKGFRVIDRFSEDIDITFDEHIGENRRKKLKNVVLKGISEILGMPIVNWEETQSDRDYNAYHFLYTSVFGLEDERLPQFVKLETALCDYYLQGKSKRYSRHLYDIYKLTPMIEFDKLFLELVKETREHRAKMPICPSAQEGIDVPAVIMEFCDKDFYREDYHAITSYFAADAVAYEDVIDTMRKIAESNVF